MESVVIMHTLPLKVTPSNHYNVVMLCRVYENVMVYRGQLGSVIHGSENWVGNWKILMLTFLAMMFDPKKP